MESDIESILDKLQHKNENKGTTTRRFKKEMFDIIMSSNFSGDILEIGTNMGNTTTILSEVAKRKGINVYSFDINPLNIKKAQDRIKYFGYSNCNVIKKDVYKEKWGVNNIGCVFIDCVHTEEAFRSDISNSIAVCVDNPIIFAHDYGICDSGIKSFLDKNKDRFKIVRFVGEKNDWNPLGSSKVCDWEGVQIRFK